MLCVYYYWSDIEEILFLWVSSSWMWHAVWDLQQLIDTTDSTSPGLGSRASPKGSRNIRGHWCDFCGFIRLRLIILLGNWHSWFGNWMRPQGMGDVSSSSSSGWQGKIPPDWDLLNAAEETAESRCVEVRWIVHHFFFLGIQLIDYVINYSGSRWLDERYSLHSHRQTKKRQDIIFEKINVMLQL